MFARVEPKRENFKISDDYKLEDIIENDESLKKLFFDYSQYDFPKWKRLEFSDFKKMPVKKYVGNFVKEGNVSLSRDALNVRKYKEFLLEKFNGVDPKFTLMALTFFNSGIFGEIDGNSKITLQYDMGKNQSVIENSGLILQPDASVVLIREYRSTGKFLNSASKLSLKRDSKLKIFNIFFNSRTDLVISSNLYDLEENAQIEIYDVIFGGQKTAINHDANLNGKNSKATFKSVYFGRGKERLDLKYAINHFGEKTYGRIESNGVLNDESYSVVRGNIDIKKTAYNADSEEKSTVTNLSPRARADSIPSLFVDNSNVVAKHGASVGNIDENKLYYLMSRGLDERSAIKLIISGIFEPFIDEIPPDNSELKGEIEDAISIRI
ncbi:SufD family Fe-S cluster assembly protein [Athalassotoga sp.]|uniref:SufD family Fe-S cluster assembly protein n=1 Tax=Athalassotoga sp. TaxID=2022597 RepID=UPI003D02C3F4